MVTTTRVGDPTNASDEPFHLGEVRTALLQSETALAQDRAAAVLDFVAGERVRRSDRPIPYAVSPDRLTGVDCRLPSATGRDTRCVGTVLGHAAITGGHVVQGSVYCRVVRSPVGRRLGWSHYLARPGTIEAIGKVRPADIVDGFLAGPVPSGVLDLGAVGTRLVDQVQAGLPARRAPFRTRRTLLRWAVRPPERSGVARASYRIDSPTDRTLELCVADDLDAVLALCEDLALHDWLLTTLVSLMEAALTEPRTREQRVERLRPAIDCLLHLWMPAARLDGSAAELWRQLDRRSGFSRQWRVSVDRIRDQVTLGMVALLEAAHATAAVSGSAGHEHE